MVTSIITKVPEVTLTTELVDAQFLAIIMSKERREMLPPPTLNKTESVKEEPMVMAE